MLQAGRSQIRVPMIIDFVFKLPNPSSHTMTLETDSACNKINTTKRFFAVKQGRRVNLTTSPSYFSRFSSKCVIFTSHNPIGLHGVLQK
jgi:hypothetical protein